MASLAGYNGLIICVGYKGRGGELPNNVISSATVFRWYLQMDRVMKEVTPLDVSDSRFLPDHGRAYVDVEGYIADTSSPGVFNIVGPMTVTLQPDQSAVRKITLTGWTERIEWNVTIGAMQTFKARIRADEEPVYMWKSAS